MSKGFMPRFCIVCQTKYSPVGPTQKRCPECIKSGKRETDPPLCGCGCGIPVKWSAHYWGWNKFIHGHHSRIDNPNKGGYPAWNKGKRKRGKKHCVRCNEQFRPRNDTHKYCSRGCYREAMLEKKSTSIFSHK